MKIDAGKVAGFLLKLPAVITGITAIVSHVKSAPKNEKVDAVLAAVPDSTALAEFAIDRDLFDDEKVKAAVQAVVVAEHALLDARAALKAIVLQKAA